MNKTELRNIALGAARAQMRRMGIDPIGGAGDDALAVLDDLARTEPTLLASQWYISASDAEIRRFKKFYEAQKFPGER